MTGGLPELAGLDRLIHEPARLLIMSVLYTSEQADFTYLLTETGLEFDRAWMLVDEQGAFLTQRAVPRMALIRPRIARDQGALLLQAPGLGELRVPLATDVAPPHTPVVVWKDTVPAWDMGDEAARWL